MDIEKAIKIIEGKRYTDLGEKVAFKMAIAALRVQQEPLDRNKWEGCETCRNGRYRSAEYCPGCGKPLTKEAWAELEKKTCNVLPDHIRELLLAEREGRLIVMPFKLGDIIYRVVTTSKYLSRPKNVIYVKRIKIKPENVHKYVDEVGESVFLTRAEAETELERRIGGNDGIN